MPKNVTMKARDTIAAKLAECFITIGSRRYNFMQMIDMEAKVEKTKTTVPRLGAIMAVISHAVWKVLFRHGTL